MAYLQTLYLVVNDTLPNIVFTLEDRVSNSVIDLTGAVVRLRIREVGTTTEKAVLVCVPIDLPNGQVSTNFPVGVLDTAGTFEAELEITFNGGGIQTMYDKIKLIVRDEVG
jgi:hypothetical protein